MDNPKDLPKRWHKSKITELLPVAIAWQENKIGIRKLYFDYNDTEKSVKSPPVITPRAKGGGIVKNSKTTSQTVTGKI